MKDKTADDPAAGKPERPGEGEQRTTRPDRTMQSEFHARNRARGRLSREDQRRLGDILQRIYDDVLKHGVPDRFKTLIDQIGSNETSAELDEEAPNHPKGAAPEGDAVHGMQAKSSDKSKDEL
jgi:hypothetical protein